jgi:TubC N-terminal docking domain
MSLLTDAHTQGIKLSLNTDGTLRATGRMGASQTKWVRERKAEIIQHLRGMDGLIEPSFESAENLEAAEDWFNSLNADSHDLVWQLFVNAATGIIHHGCNRTESLVTRLKSILEAESLKPSVKGILTGYARHHARFERHRGSEKWQKRPHLQLEPEIQAIYDAREICALAMYVFDKDNAGDWSNQLKEIYAEVIS